MKHVMIDLETWGKRAGFAIRSIGACTFRPVSTKDFNDPRIIGERFYVNVNRASCEAAGLKVDASTEKWWEDQGEAAQTALLLDQLPLADAIMKFLVWWQNVDPTYVWANGASFDPPILEASILAAGHVDVPWQFWNIRDTRTLWDMAQVNHKMWPRVGVHHKADDDAVHQARVCAMASGVLFPVAEPTQDEALAGAEASLRNLGAAT